jgi:hypothetical protein
LDLARETFRTSGAPTVCKFVRRNAAFEKKRVADLPELSLPAETVSWHFYH